MGGGDCFVSGDHFNQLSSWSEMAQWSIERQETRSVTCSQPDQKRVIDLIRAEAPAKQFLQLLPSSGSGFKKHMIPIVDQLGKKMASFGGGFRSRNHCGIAREPDKGGLR
jgi:hypothetical protein